MWTLLASLELLPIATKLEFGDLIAALLSGRRSDGGRPSLIWALGRLGQRVPVYGPLNTVVPTEKAVEWFQVLLAQPDVGGIAPLAVMQLVRRTDDRYRDVDEHTREIALQCLAEKSASDHLVKLVRDGGSLDTDEQGQVVGESLPKGLRIL
jgi:hypothetical protein